MQCGLTAGCPFTSDMADWGDSTLDYPFSVAYKLARVSKNFLIRQSENLAKYYFMSEIASGRNYKKEFNETVYFSSRLRPVFVFFYIAKMLITFLPVMQSGHGWNYKIKEVRLMTQPTLLYPKHSN
jgi:hypothetical protein